MSLSNIYEEFGKVYLLEQHRIDSFKVWPFDDASSCSKLEMAKAGFYWTGTNREPDTATCFVCHKVLDCWQETDKPWKEHAKYAPQCMFVKLGKSQKEITLKDFLIIFGTVLINNAQREDEDKKRFLKASADKMLKRFQKEKSANCLIRLPLTTRDTVKTLPS